MKKNKFLNKHAKLISLGLIALAFLFFLWAAAVDKSAHQAGFVTLLVFFLIFFVTGIGFFGYATKHAEVRVCYFYYDRRKQRRIPREELTFELANDNLDFYLSEYVAQPIELFSEVPKPLRIQLQAEPAFAPLVAFKMLYELSLLEGDALTECFSAADERAVGFICRSIAKCGDEEMADLLARMKRNPELERARVLAFFTKNRRWFEGRILHYIQQRATQLTVLRERFERKGENS